jgi:hypothetical protein
VCGRAEYAQFVPLKPIAQTSLINRRRKPFMIIPTPLPGLATVTLYHDTWFDKITKNHVEMLGTEDDVRLVVSSPTAVCIASSNPGYRVFATIRSEVLADDRC